MLIEFDVLTSGFLILKTKTRLGSGYVLVGYLRLETSYFLHILLYPDPIKSGNSVEYHNRWNRLTVWVLVFYFKFKKELLVL